MAFPGIPDEILNEDVELIRNRYGVEAPHRKSIHVYQFSNKVNTKEIAEKFRQLPYVVNAYMTPILKFGASANLLSSTNLSSSISPAPVNDTEFSNPESDWWWFNRQKVFHGWNYYGSTTMPKIAIVDSGFDNRIGAPDKPNYQGGTSIKFDPTCPKPGCPDPWIVGSDVFEYTTDNPYIPYSHGAMVASIAASPKDNNLGFAGIAAGATILPYKTVSYQDVGGNYYLHENAIANAIFQSSFSDADVINISIEVGSGFQGPVIRSPVLYNEVLAALSRGKAVVIIAGNSGVDIDYSYLGTPSNLPPCDCIIVGGTEEDPNATYHSKAWLGSNFGERIDISAGAVDIIGSTFTVSSGSTLLKQDTGTSFSAPMVSAAVGMMKQIALANGHNLSPSELKQLVLRSATLSRYSTKSPPGGIYSAETQFLGMGLEPGTDIITDNWTTMVGIRELNLYNALVLSKNSNQYPAMVRVHNVDDFVWMAFNWNWGAYYQSQFGDDKIYGITGINSGDILSFSTYNSSGSYAYGYQVYKGAQPVFDNMGGVAYVTGVQGNNSFPAGWYQTQGYTY